MKKHIVLTLQNPLNESDLLDIKFNVTNTDIGSDWFHCCSEALKNNSRLEKNFCWLGWPDPNRTVSYLSEKLNNCVDIINEFADSNTTLWSGYRINKNWDDISTDDALNQLHHHFEILMGQVWDVAIYMKTANDKTSYYIRQLNNLVHELASRKTANTMGGMTIASYLNPVRSLLMDSYYDNFSLQRNFGDVFLHYAQTGKTPIEAFEDDDDYVFNNNINALRYMSGEFNIWWSGSTSEAQIMKKKNALRKWLHERNVIMQEEGDFCYYVDLEGNKQGIGWLVVAELENQFKTSQDLAKEIAKRLNIYKVECFLNNESVSSKTWDYKWTDSNYEENEIEFLSPLFPRL